MNSTELNKSEQTKRSLFLWSSVIFILFGLAAIWFWPSWQQRNAATHIRELNGAVGYEWGARYVRGEEPESPSFVQVLLGVRVESVYFPDGNVTDADLSYLSVFSELEYLDLNDTAISDDGLVHLANLKKLEELYLYRTKVTNAGVQKLQRKIPKATIYHTW
jgi:Leucine-rich repeat (LRR) protein